MREISRLERRGRIDWERVISVASELDSEPPRPLAEINHERDELGTLFLSEDGSKRIGSGCPQV